MSAAEKFAKITAASLAVHQLLFRILIDKGIVKREELLQLLSESADETLKTGGGAEAAAVFEGLRRVLDAGSHPAKRAAARRKGH